MHKLYSLGFLLLVAITTVNAQRNFVNGYLRDSVTHFPISGGYVNNPATNQRVTTNQAGFFRIEAAPGDKLYTSASDYRLDTFTISVLFADTVSIYLAPTGYMLPTVTVTAPYTKYQLDSIKRREEFNKAKGPPMSAVETNRSQGFGINFNLDRGKKKYKDQKHAEYVFSHAEDQAYVDYRFSAQIVANYTGLQGDQLKTFLSRYTPTYEWLREHPTDEAVMDYLNEKLKEFRGTPPK
jgi:flagellar hook protein FlgE